MTAGENDGRHGYSRSRSAVEDYLPSRYSVILGNNREGEKDSSSQDGGGGSRESLLLVMVQERRDELEARRRRWAEIWPPLPNHQR